MTYAIVYFLDWGESYCIGSTVNLEFYAQQILIMKINMIQSCSRAHITNVP